MAKKYDVTHFVMVDHICPSIHCYIQLECLTCGTELRELLAIERKSSSGMMLCKRWSMLDRVRNSESDGRNPSPGRTTN